MLLKIRNTRTSPEIASDFVGYASPVIRAGRLEETKNYIQHGTTSVYSHSVTVAYYSLKIAEWMNIPCDFGSLVTGALLHDYFLYDWHKKDKSHSWHGFTHPRRALDNAIRDFDLNPVEQDAIMRHMFPLTPIPPKYRESLIVCLMDKYCSVIETLRINKIPLPDCADVWGERRESGHE